MAYLPYRRPGTAALRLPADRQRRRPPAARDSRPTTPRRPPTATGG